MSETPKRRSKLELFFYNVGFFSMIGSIIFLIATPVIEVVAWVKGNPPSIAAFLGLLAASCLPWMVACAISQIVLSLLSRNRRNRD